MKLTDLDPRWVAFGHYPNTRLGVSFECPHCRTTRLAVPFHHDGHAAADDADIIAAHPEKKGKYIWNMTGASFEDLSLTPSVDASASGHWHGFIKTGEVTNA